MAVDFFEHQDSARRRTWLLVFLFVLAVIAIIAAVYGICALVLIQDEGNYWDPQIFALVTLATVGVVLLGSLYKISELSAGGEKVALMLGGRRLNAQTHDLAERRLLNVVEEMALASGISVPPVYVMDQEWSINAFAAGHQPGNAVIGVSRGSLEFLNRDELQGVVAHEFSHILNGDMRMNLRLVGILNGILLLAIIGYFMMRMAGSSSRSRSSNKEGGGAAAAILAIGLGLLVIGYLGVFFGKLIKASVSRQREYLADASAVQFTRYPDGIGGALKKIGGLRDTSRIKDPHAEEVSHMFFSDAFSGFATRLLSTHPPLVKRIQRIDPSFDGKFPEVRPVSETFEKEEKEHEKKRREAIDAVQRAREAVASGQPIPLDPAGVTGRVGMPGMAQMVLAGALLEAMPQPARDAAREPYGARAVIYALLLDKDPAMREKQLAALKTRAEELSFKETNRIVPLLDDMPDEARLPLVDTTFPALKQLSPDQYRAFRDNVQALVEADEKLDLFEYAIRAMLFRNLDVQFGLSKPARARYYSVRAVAEPVACVLSVLARSGQETEEDVQLAFHEGMKDLGHVAGIQSKDACTLHALDQALTQLAECAPQVKKRIMTACAATIAADQQVTPRESDLLRAIAATLDCPLPPLAAG